MTGALGISIKKGTQILGQNAENNLEVKLVAYADYDATDSEIQVQYVPNTDITKSCYVGGLQSLEQITLGCKCQTSRTDRVAFSPFLCSFTLTNRFAAPLNRSCTSRLAHRQRWYTH